MPDGGHQGRLALLTPVQGRQIDGAPQGRPAGTNRQGPQAFRRHRRHQQEADPHASGGVGDAPRPGRYAFGTQGIGLDADEGGHEAKEDQGSGHSQAKHAACQGWARHLTFRQEFLRAPG